MGKDHAVNENSGVAIIVPDIAGPDGLIDVIGALVMAEIALVVLAGCHTTGLCLYLVGEIG